MSRLPNWLNDNGHPTPRETSLKMLMFIQKKRKRRLEI